MPVQPQTRPSALGVFRRAALSLRRAASPLTVAGPSVVLSLAMAGCVDRAKTVDLPARAPMKDPASIKPASAMSESVDAQISRPAPQTIGSSRHGSPIIAYVFDHPAEDQPSRAVLVFAGIHGNETSTVFAARQLLDLLHRSSGEIVPPGVRLVVVPLVNPDGYAVKKRQNASRVDLNRNFPATNWKQSSNRNYWNGPAPLSEPESKALHDLVLDIKPVRILSLHSIRPPRHGNNFDGPARTLAELLASHNRYPVLPTMGYPTPGSFGSWAGVDLQIPTITLEFPSTEPAPKVWADNREAILAFIRGR
jgi:murein peptide amidase A